MSFDWSDYLSLAQRLAQESDEAALRCATSRAYYAAYNTARRYKDAHLGTYSPDMEEGSHQAVWNFFRRRPDMNARFQDIWVWSARLKTARVKADYKDNAAISQQSAKDTCQMAAKLIHRLSNL